MKYTDDQIQQQIEAYLNQDMTDLERSRFEKLIHDDQELHEEVEIQEATLEAIRQERMLALKAGMSNVNISLWSAGLMEAAKIAAITASIGIASVGGYFYYQSQQTPKSVANKEIHAQGLNPSSSNASQSKVEIQENSNNETPVSFESNSLNGEAPTTQSKSSDKSETQPMAGSWKGSKPESKANQQGMVATSAKEAAVFEPTTKSIQPLTGKDVPLPEDGISNKSSLETIHPEVVIKRDNKNIFHYQFSDSKLVLYADFSNKLYEVLELNQDNTKRLFFCYDSHFYQLDPNQSDIAPLKEVQDKSMIQILTAYQKRRN